jgi:hypothetical protein
MKRLRSLCPIAILLVCIICVPLLLSAQEKKEGEEVYTIKKGDTLWDISGKFLKDTFLWPKLWQRNPYITNPHWIYPGQPIRLTAMEPPKGPAPVTKKVGPAAEKKPVVEEVKPVEVKPVYFSENKYAGFYSNVDYPGIGIILDNREGKTFIATDDIVYLGFKTSEPIKIGDKFTVFRRGNRWATSLQYSSLDRIVDKIDGRKYMVFGIVQIIDQNGDFYTGRIVDAYFGMQRGDRLMPYLKEKMEGGEEKK